MAGHVLEWYANCLSGELDSFPGSQLSKLGTVGQSSLLLTGKSSSHGPQVRYLKHQQSVHSTPFGHLWQGHGHMDTNCDNMKLYINN